MQRANRYFSGRKGDFPQHSETDDEADRRLFPSIYGWMDSNYPHASAIMLPSGRIIGRTVIALPSLC
jgi:hypothetical protein